ncbi:MAG: hypothetical protein ACRDTQ_12745 [Micromonosporaceae bacterium]
MARGRGGAATPGDQMLVARLRGAALRLTARTATPVRQEAVAEIRAMTTRADLLGRAAGLLAGADHLDRAWYDGAAWLLLHAGADPCVAGAAATEAGERTGRDRDRWSYVKS